MMVDKILRKDERNWLVLINGINKSSAEGVALTKSEDYYTHIVNYDPEDSDHGYAVYVYWRYWGDAGLPKIEESEDWQIKRLKYAIERHVDKLQMHKNYVARYQQELINFRVEEEQ